MTQIEEQGVSINLTREPWVKAQSFQFRSEQEGLPHPSIIERFFTKSIAHEMELAHPSIPQDKGEHAIKGLYRSLQTPSTDGCQNDLRVGMASEEISDTLQVLP